MGDLGPRPRPQRKIIMTNRKNDDLVWRKIFPVTTKIIDLVVAVARVLNALLQG